VLTAKADGTAKLVPLTSNLSPIRVSNAEAIDKHMPLCPFTKQRHQSYSQEDTDQHEGQLFVVFRSVRVEQEIAGQQFD